MSCYETNPACTSEERRNCHHECQGKYMPHSFEKFTECLRQCDKPCRAACGTQAGLTNTLSKTTKIAIGVASVALILGVVYLVAKKK